jgi:hypothetical protein
VSDRTKATFDDLTVSEQEAIHTRAYQSHFDTLSGAAKDVMLQLFVAGPTWDGNVVAKSGRNELCNEGLAFHNSGWASLTEEGVRMAVRVDVKSWANQSWYQKQNQLGRY